MEENGGDDDCPSLGAFVASFRDASADVLKQDYRVRDIGWGWRRSKQAGLAMFDRGTSTRCLAGQSPQARDRMSTRLALVLGSWYLVNQVQVR